MAVQAHRVQPALSAVGRLGEVAFKVFAGRLASSDESMHTTPAPSTVGTPGAADDNIGSVAIDPTLLRIEAALLYEDQLAAVVGRELWTFSMDPGSQPAPDPPISLSRGMPMAATGIVSFDQDKPSTVSRAHILSPLLSALENACRVRLLRQGPSSFLPFGRDAVLSVWDGSVMRVEVSVWNDSELRVCVVATRAELRPLGSSGAGLHATGPAVWLLPSGKLALVVGAGTVNAVDAPSPELACIFHAYLRATQIVFVTLEALEESPWLHVSCEGRTLMWPVALVVASSSGISSAQNYTRRQNPYEELEMRMRVPYEERHQKEQSQHQSQEQNTPDPPPKPQLKLHQAINPPPAPPPTPTLGRRSVADMSEHQQVYPTPHYHSPAVPTPAEPSSAIAEEIMDDWGMEEDVTNADFNFFDQPVKAPDTETTTTMAIMAQTGATLGIDEHPYEIGSRACKTETEQVSPSLRVQNPESLAPPRGVFSEVKFDKNVYQPLDSRYLEGGRFHYTMETLQEEEESPDPKESASDSDIESAGSSSDSSGEVDFMEAEADAEADWDDFGDLSRLRWAPSGDEIRRLQQSWAAILDSPLVGGYTPGTDIGSSSMGNLIGISNENLQLLMAQVVWDAGSLYQFMRLPLLANPVVPGDAVVNHCLEGLFSELRPLSIGELAGFDPDKPDPKDDFVLLSPPLYNFVRMSQPHKARASALRFWRLLDLRPQAPPRDIVVIIMALANAGVQERIRISLDMLKDVYSDCGLGEIDLPTVGPVKNGVFPIQADMKHAEAEDVGEIFEIACSQLKKVLLNSFSPQTRVALVTVFPPPSTGVAASFLPLARGFQALRSGLSDARWLLASLDTFVSPWNSDVVAQVPELERMALLLYDRWVHRTNVNLVQGAESAFSLAHLASQSISLKFQADPPAHVLDEDPIMHMAYNVSPDRRWVCASWTDQWARLTRTEVFRVTPAYARTRAASPAAGVTTTGSLDDEESPRRVAEALVAGDQSLLGVFVDIWHRTTQLCVSVGNSTSVSNRKWRLVILKCNKMDASELGIWKRLAKAVSGDISFDLSVAYLPYPQGLVVPQVFSTKVAETPQDDAVVVMVGEETHGLTLTPKAPIFGSVGAGPSPVALGYLVKRGGPDANDVLLEVRLVHSSQPQADKRRRMLNLVLGQFRRLASLAELTGITTEPTVLPWHAAAVNKMTAFLASVLLI